MADTSIEWVRGDDGSEGKTWNPTDGCEVCSPGCANCYAMRFAGRFSKPGQRYHGLVAIAKNKRAVWSGEGRLDARKLGAPLSWRKPTRVFVNSMSDLFYEQFTNEEIAAVFGVMAACPQHTFMILTKRAKRMREWFEWAGRLNLDVLRAFAYRAINGDTDEIRVRRGSTWPLANVWLGVSVENQDAAEERIPELLATPATARFLSCEPLLGMVDLRCVQHNREFEVDTLTGHHGVTRPLAGRGPSLDWVIAGCESGPGARPCDVAWLRSLRDQCVESTVPFFLKQAKYVDGPRGTRSPISTAPPFGDITKDHGAKHKAGGVIGAPYLDGVQWLQWPGVRP